MIDLFGRSLAVELTAAGPQEWCDSHTKKKVEIGENSSADEGNNDANGGNEWGATHKK